MADERPKEPADSFQRFRNFARALFGVDRRDVPKHEPKKREKKSTLPLAAKR
jgi:hypothetical protein